MLKKSLRNTAAMTGGLLLIAASLSLAACSSGGGSNSSPAAEPTGEAPEGQVLVIINNQFRQGVTVRYGFGTNRPRRVGNIRSRSTQEFTVRPLTSGLYFEVEYSDGRTERSMTQRVQPGEVWELLIRDQFAPELKRQS